MTFQIGQVLGEYKIVRALGRGGLGAVYEAKHLISQRSEAMKVMLPEQLGTPDMAQRFRREVQLLAALNHPNIAGLHNAFYFEEQLVMIMELVEGEDLSARSRRMRIPLPDLLDYAAQVLTALEYAHARGVVHRDIKPANIMVGPDGSVKLLDFGIALTERATDLTAAGALIGSPTHMSPEQIRGEKATPQSDFYALGVTIYELIAGQPPIKGASNYELMMAHINHIPRPLHELRPDIAPHLSDVIAKALTKDPAQRYATASEFLTALRGNGGQNGVDWEKTTTTRAVESWQRISTDELNKPTTASAALPINQIDQIDPLIKHLASFIGPIAKIVVSRLAKQFTDIDQLYTEAAKQIEKDSERQRFLRTRPRRVV